MTSIDAKFSFGGSPFPVELKSQEGSEPLTAQFGSIRQVTQYVGGDPYNGTYVVTPKVTEQTMPTKGKVMDDDVTVKAIPIYETTNESGGTTVYIAKEV